MTTEIFNGAGLPRSGARRFSAEAGMSRSQRPEPGDHRAHRLRGDEDVEPEGKVLDVEEVVVKLAGRGLDLGDIALIDLRPAGDPRPHDVAVGVERDLAVVPS